LTGMEANRNGGKDAPTLEQLVAQVRHELENSGQGYNKRTIVISSRDSQIINAEVHRHDSYRLSPG